MFNTWLAVAVGGAIGATLRYASALGINAWLKPSFPYATLFVNVSGSLAFGFLAIWLSERWPMAADIRAFVLVGVLGAFTTFSTFSWETVALLQEGDIARAAGNMLASVLLCVVAAFAGVMLARQLV